MSLQKRKKKKKRDLFKFRYMTYTEIVFTCDINCNQYKNVKNEFGCEFISRALTYWLI